MPTSKAKPGAKTDAVPEVVSTSTVGVKEKSWWRESKPTEWITCLLTFGGLIAVFASGILDAKKAETSAQNERLTMEKMRLEDRKETAVRELADVNGRLEKVNARLLPLEKERVAIRYLMYYRKKYPIERPKADSFWLTFDLANDLQGWRLIVEPTFNYTGAGAWNEPRKIGIFGEIGDILKAASNIESLQSLSITGCDLNADEIQSINACHGLRDISEAIRQLLPTFWDSGTDSPLQGQEPTAGACCEWPPP